MIDWLIGNMGTEGVYMYQAIHWYSLAAVLLAVAAAVVFCICNRKNSTACRKLLVGISVFQVVFEVIWRLVYLFIKGDSILCWWPAYACNLGGVLLPIIALLNWKKGKQMFYLFGFVGGVLTFAMPDGIFCREVFVFPILKSVLQHTGLLVIPLIEYVSGSYRPTLKDYGWLVAGCLVHLANCEGICRLLGFTEDFLFLRSDLPFVIPGVPQWITMSVFALAVFALLSFLCDIPGSIKWIRGLSRTEEKQL